MREGTIIGLVGIVDSKGMDGMWDSMSPAFREYFFGWKFQVERRQYQLWQRKKIREYGKHVLDTYDTGEDVLLVGHSLGGIVACAIADKFRKSKVRGVVTINSPHTYPCTKLISPFFSYAGGKGELKAPIVTVGSWLDCLVPCCMTKHPKALHHDLYIMGHQDELVANKHHVAENIAGLAAEAFAEVRR